jgi:hypothetical protein
LPVRLRRVASGLMIEKVRSVAMGQILQKSAENRTAFIQTGPQGRKAGRFALLSRLPLFFKPL